MDKYEYKVRAQEIRDLIASSQYDKAAEIADTIDWSRVKKASFLCTISDLYKINKRYEDAIELLQLAYDRYPGGKDILYSLCELYLSTGDTIRAITTFREFCQVAPTDVRMYILQYKVYVAQDVSLEERIEVLEKLKKRDYRDKWAYTLAYLYHRVGLATKCVEECDALISWFGEGKYVDMAMELKMLHQPLNEQQQAMYNERIESVASDSRWEGKKRSDSVSGNTAVWSPVKDKTAKTSEVDGNTKVVSVFPKSPAEGGTPEVTPMDEAVALSLGHTQVYRGNVEEPEISVKTVDVGDYNTINLQRAIAEGVQEVLENGVTGALPTKQVVSGVSGEDVSKASTKKIFGVDEKAILASDTKEIPGTEDDMPPHIDFDPHIWDKDVEEEISGDSFEEPGEPVSDYTQYLGAVADKLRASTGDKSQGAEEEGSADRGVEFKAAEGNTAYDPVAEPAEKNGENVGFEGGMLTNEETTGSFIRDEFSAVEEEALSAQPPEQIATVLSQEGDGQIRFVVPETPETIKQITGQLNIDDVMAEWARMKREHEEMNRKQYHEQIKQQTGELFNEFEAAALSGVLETLQKEEDEKAAETVEEIDVTPAEEVKIPETESAEESALDGDAADITDDGESPVGSDDEVEEITEVEEVFAAVDDDYTADEEIFETSEDDEPAVETAEAVEQAYVAGEVPEGGYEVTEGLYDTYYENNTESEVFDIYPNEEPDEYGINNRTKQFYEKKLEESKKAVNPEEDEDDGEEVRELTKEEKELFGPYVQSKSARKQLVGILDGTSMASYSGNIILTGGDGNDTSDLATAIMRDIKQTDSNFSGKVARITGDKLNNKKVASVVKQLANGALIIEKANKMNDETASELYRSLDQENLGIIVTVIDTERNMEKLLSRIPRLTDIFTVRMNLKPLTAEQLADFAVKYAYEKEYSIDEMGMLGLHTQITLRQTATHSVNIVEVKEIVDNAINNVNRKNAKHFFDVLLGKRYDKEDMIILGESDFK
ncbi:MAG: tetratricopeptide repeat protein [Lachnospiraceae bacterium]|nr:tetratricopeptide repeat protein [Lachnospiraceae bacterium]